MRRSMLITFIALVIASHVQGSTISAKGGYPRFQVGVTGIYATIEAGPAVTVADTEAGSPAEGKLSKGDVIIAAGGKMIEGQDVRVPLGEALTAAEATDGKLVLKVKRGDRVMVVTVTVPVLGAYSKTWPLNCAKSQAIIRQAAEHAVKSQQADGAYALDRRADRDGLSACMVGLFLLSTGDDKYLPAVRLQARGLAARSEKSPSGSSWHLGLQGVLLAEYYLRTGDKAVLGGIKAICNQAARTQHAGAWSHGASSNPGYVQSGLMNSAGVPVLTAMVLARECGVDVPEAAFKRALKFFYRMAGHGSVCYGDHRSELFPNTNGRNGMLACALAALDAKPYRMARRHLALIMTDSYYAHEFGHTGGGFNVIWRGPGTSHVPAANAPNIQRHMAKLAWYFDLTRLRGGGFSLLPSPPTTTRYCGALWGTGGVGLTYTSPLKTLRITGSGPTKYSAKVTAPVMDWGTEADLNFLRTDYAAGFGPETAQPDEIYAKLWRRSDAPVGFCAKMMRHYSPMVRTWAGRALGNRPDDDEAVNAIVAGLKHSDPRVRRAACDGFSGYDNWGRGRPGGKIPAAVISARFLPHVVKMLKDPKAAWWEIDGAMWALGRAEPADIRKNWDLVLKFSQHEEWYIREASFWAVVGLHKTITGDEFEFLANMYAKSGHVFARSSYDAGFNMLLSRDKVTLDPATEARVARILGRTTHTIQVAQGDGVAGQHEAAHRTMMVLKHFDQARVYKHIVGDLTKYLETWTPDYQHSAWLITGSPWQPGLVKIVDYLGKDAKPLVAGLKNALETKVEKNSRNKAHTACREALQKAVADYEKKYGQ